MEVQLTLGENFNLSHHDIPPRGECVMVQIELVLPLDKFYTKFYITVIRGSQDFVWRYNLGGRPRGGLGAEAPPPTRENFQKFSTIFLIPKMHYFGNFTKKVENCLMFSRIWTKNTNCW